MVAVAATVARIRAAMEVASKTVVAGAEEDMAGVALTVAEEAAVAAVEAWGRCLDACGGRGSGLKCYCL